MDVSALPPRPDPHTGQPRPPHAPLDPGWSPGDRDHSASNGPGPPPGQSPILESYRPSTRVAVGTGVFCAAILFLYASLRLHGLRWVIEARAWPVWLIVLSMVPLYFRSLRADRITAGADWLRYRKQWVRTYELTSVSLKPSGPKLMLQLVDRDQRKLRIPLYFMQKHRELWDLVYNGILHSVYLGHAEVDAGARHHLKLPYSLS